MTPSSYSSRSVTRSGSGLVLAAYAIGEGEGGDVVLLLEGDVDLVGHAEGILEDLRPAGEELRDLGRALEIEAVVVMQPVLVVAVLPEPDAEEDVVGVVVGVAEKVGVVGGEHREPYVSGEREDPLVELRLEPAGVVGLDLQVIAPREDLRVPRRDRLRLVEAVREEVRCDLSGHARRRHDDPLAVALEELAVDARLGVEALGVGERGELDEVAKARAVTGEERQVVALVATIARSRALAPVARRDVGLHTYDRFDARLTRLLLELPRRVQIAVVGDRQRRLLELLSPVDQVGDPVGAVEERILGVTVKMDE